MSDELHVLKQKRFLEIDEIKQHCKDKKEYETLVQESNSLIDWFHTHPDEHEPTIMLMIRETQKIHKDLNAYWSSWGVERGLMRPGQYLRKCDDCGKECVSDRVYYYHQLLVHNVIILSPETDVSLL